MKQDTSSVENHMPGKHLEIYSTAALTLQRKGYIATRY